MNDIAQIHCRAMYYLLNGLYHDATAELRCSDSELANLRILIQEVCTEHYRISKNWKTSLCSKQSPKTKYSREHCVF